MLERTLESPLEIPRSPKEIKPVNPDRKQSRIFIDAEVEVPVLWPPDEKS